MLIQFKQGKSIYKKKTKNSFQCDSVMLVTVSCLFFFYIPCPRPMLTCEPETNHKDRGKNTLYLWWAVTVGSGDNVAQVSPPDEHPLPAASHTHHSTSANKTRGTWGTMWPGHRQRQRHANVDPKPLWKKMQDESGGEKRICSRYAEVQRPKGQSKKWMFFFWSNSKSSNNWRGYL